MRRPTKPLVFPRVSALTALSALYAFVALFAGCGLSTRSIPPTDGGSACASVADCADDDPCTTDACSSEGTCVHTPLPNGTAPAAVQLQGTCTKIVCTDGVASTVADDANVPTPATTCLSASCSDGKPTTTPLADGVACTLKGQGGVCANGVCTVACTMASDCPSMGPCTVASCDGSVGMCVYQNLPDGMHTPGIAQPMGTCQAIICQGGASATVADDSNAPVNVMGACSVSTCDDGTLDTKLSPKGTPCSVQNGKYCDANGNCVECNSITDCPKAPDDCQVPVCTGGQCNTAFVDAGTPTNNPPKVPGSCTEFVCAGGLVGGVDYVSVVDPENAPDAGTPCATDSCALDGGVIVTPHPSAKCGTNDAEMCTDAGQCGCMVAADCSPPDNMCVGGVCVCTPNVTCATFGLTCGTHVDNCGNTLNCNDGKDDGNETDVDCGGDDMTCPTRCAAGKKCDVNSDCAGGVCMNGICCSGAACPYCETCGAGTGNCVALPSGTKDTSGTCTMSAQDSCGEIGTCNGSGGCADWATGTPCLAQSCTAGVISLPATCNGLGACNKPSTTSCAPYATCSGADCATSCGQNSDCTAGNFCTGGHCTGLLGQGSACTGTASCMSGLTCVDGFCCDSTCTGQCQACSSAMTGMPNGTCANVTVGSADPSSTCKNEGGCGTNGMCAAGGVCQFYGAATPCTNGPTCSTSGAVVYTACDGNGSCLGSPTASACANDFGCTAGTASPCPTTCTAGTPTGCAATYFCQGGSACVPLEGSGQACTVDAGCSSGDCLGGFCCASSCVTSGVCGASACVTSTGACDYPTVACGTGGCADGLDGGTVTTGFCDGGGCEVATTLCFPFECNGSTGVCATSCGADGGSTLCAPGYFCNGLSANGCQVELMSGDPCTYDYECTSGVCALNDAGSMIVCD